MANEGIELYVYPQGNPFDLKAVLHGRVEPTYLDEVNGVGGGSFKVLRSDPQIIEDPTLLAYRNVVRVKVNGKWIGAYLIRTNNPAIIDENPGKEYKLLAGEGLLAWFTDADVKPYGGLKKTSPKSRFFSFASEEGSWYDASDWVAPTILGNVRDIDPWKTKPDKWPENDTTAGPAKWIWASTQATGTCYFRKTFNVATEGDFVLYVAGDNYFDVYLDGGQIVKTDYSTEGYSSATKASFHLATGDHLVGIRVGTVDNYGGMVAALYRKGDEDVETLVWQTGNNTGWKVLGYPSVAPGWTPGQIMLTLLDEAEDRGVLFPTWITPTFTEELDSLGNAWDSTIELEAKVSGSIAEVLSKITELGYEAWMSYPDDGEIEFNIAPARGELRTEDDNAIVFERGKNLLKASSAGVGKIKNSLSVLTSEGWLVDDTQDEDSISTYGVIEGSFEADVPESIARPLIQEIFRQRATPEEGATYELATPRPGEDEIPFEDYFPGDWVMAPNDVELLVPRRIMSLSLTEGPAREAKYTSEFDTIFLSNEQRINKILGKNGGGLGGSFSNVVGTPAPGTPIIVTPGGPNTKYPKAPTGLTQASVGYWSADGVTPYSKVTLNWNDVIEFTDETAMVPLGYEIFGRRLLDSGSAYERIGRVGVSEVELRGFIPDEPWRFKIQTLSDTEVPSAYSTEIDVTPAGPTAALDAPDTPTLTSSLGLVTISWNGLLDGNPPPPQFRYVYAEIAPDVAGSPGTFIPMGHALQRDGRNISITDLTIGSKVWTHLIAVDGMGLESAASANASIIVTGVDLGDLESDVTDALEAVSEAAIEAHGTTNRLLDQSFEELNNDHWSLETADATKVGTTPRSGMRALRLEASTAAYDASVYQHPMRVDPGEQYLLSFWIRAEGAGVGQAAGVAIGVNYGATESTMTDEAIVVVSDPILASDPYDRVLGLWSVPADTYFMVPKFVVQDDDNANVYLIDDVTVRFVIPGSLIEEDGITTTHLRAESVTSAQIAAASILSEKIAAGQILAEHLAAESVTADAIKAGEITADKIAAGAIQTQHISGTVGAEIDLSNNNTITIISTRIDGVQADADGTQADLNELGLYYSFTPDGAIISTPDSPLAVAILNDRIEMRENGNVISYWNSGQMYVSQFVGQKVILGNHQLEDYGSNSTVVRAVGS